MVKKKVFISSVQNEFAQERQALADYLRQDVLLSVFFEAFTFEEVPANTLSPQKVYLSEVKNSDIYLGLLGSDYGYEDEKGISPSEYEYNQARIERLQRWIFIKDVANRHPKEQALIRKIEQDVSRKKFTDIKSLKKAVYHSCIRFLQQKGFINTHEFDSSLNHQATLSELNDDLITDFVRTAKGKRNFPLKESDSKERILIALNMFRNNTLLNSSLLVFASNPQKYFPSATIKCAHFHGNTIQKPIPDYKEFKGTVFSMADETVDFSLSKISLSTGARNKDNIVETTYEVPRAVIAEAVINAVAHRDYSSSAGIQVAVFKNRIEISNPGQLPSELSIEDLKIPHSSYPHNPILADCMFQYGAIERYGTGTLDIFNLTKERGLKVPEYTIDGDFKLTLWRPSSAADHLTDHVTDHVTDHEPIGNYKDIDDPAHRLVFVMSGEMSRKELMEKLDLKHQPTFRENYLSRAQKEAYIEMTIPETPKSTKQKYRLTQAGHALKNQLKNERK